MKGPGAIVAQRYEILARLAAGGMGVVFRARHRVSRHLVALKVMHPIVALDPASVARFAREARVAAAIGHDGIVQVLDAGSDDDGTLYLAMELLEGESLRARLTRADVTRGEAIALIDALLDPLSAAHAAGFVHRDLKPENVFVTREGRTKLLDFGIAKEIAPASATLTGAAIGTPHYMAPEQVMSAKGATPASDVWAVGVMLYEILAGRPPFDGPTPHAVVVRACVEAPTPVTELAPGVGPELAELVTRALSKDPSARPADAAALRSALRAALTNDPDSSREAVTLRPPPPEPGSESEPTLPASPLEIEQATRRSDRPAARESSRSASSNGWSRIEGAGFSLSTPPGWSQRPSSIPSVAVLVVEDASQSLVVPTQLRLKIEAFEGDTRAYVDLGLTNVGRVAHILRTTDADLAGMPAVDVEAQLTLDPPTRMFSRAAARDGTGYVVQCTTDPARWNDAAPVLRAIIATLRLPRRSTGPGAA